MRSFLAFAVAGAALMTAPALADKVGGGHLFTSLDGTITADGGDLVAERVVTPVVVGGNDSWDTFLDASNDVFSVALAPNAHVTGIGYDVTIATVGASWLDEARVEMTDTAITGGVGLTPGVGNSAPGAGAFSSGGIIDLVGLGLDFNVGADGLLRFEFWETFDDVANAIDANWLDPGVINIQWVPEPASFALLALGALALRRR